MVGLAPGQLVLECSVEAEPAPEIEWHRDGILLQVGAGLGTQGRHLLCRSGPGPCSLDPQCWGRPPLALHVPAFLASRTPLITVMLIFWMGTLRQG